MRDAGLFCAEYIVFIDRYDTETLEIFGRFCNENEG